MGLIDDSMYYVTLYDYEVQPFSAEIVELKTYYFHERDDAERFMNKKKQEGYKCYIGTKKIDEISEDLT